MDHDPELPVSECDFDFADNETSVDDLPGSQLMEPDEWTKEGDTFNTQIGTWPPITQRRFSIAIINATSQTYPVAIHSSIPRLRSISGTLGPGQQRVFQGEGGPDYSSSQSRELEGHYANVSVSIASNGPWQRSGQWLTINLRLQKSPLMTNSARFGITRDGELVSGWTRNSSPGFRLWGSPMDDPTRRVHTGKLAHMIY